MIHEHRQEGEECNALKEMPISLWILHSIKNTAADDGVEEVESKEEELKEKRKLGWEQKPPMLYEKDLSLPERKKNFADTK